MSKEKSPQVEGALSLSWTLALLLAGCARSYLSSGTEPLIATSRPSEIPSPTRVAPSETPEPSLTPASSEPLVAEAQVADPFALAWSPRGDLIAVTTAGGLVFLGDVNLLDQRLIPTEKPLEFLAFAPDGDRLATSEAGTRFQVWSMPGPRLQVEQEITINDTFGVSFDDRGTLYVTTESGGESLAIRAFTGDAVTGGLFIGDGAGWVVDIAIAPSGEIVAFNGFEGVEVWSFETQSLVKVLNGERAAALRFRPDSSLLAAAHWDGLARLWSIDSGEVIQSFLWGGGQVSGPRTGLDFSPDGRLLAVAGQEGRIVIWDTGTQTIAHTFDIPLRTFNSIDFSPDGTKLASIGEDGLLQIWAVGP